MPLYLSPDHETRATTHPVMAALEGFLSWWVLGPKQHDADLLRNLGAVPRFIAGEGIREGVQS